MQVHTTKDRVAQWRAKAEESGMSFKEWVERTLDDAPIYKITVTAVRK